MFSYFSRYIDVCKCNECAMGNSHTGPVHGGKTSGAHHYHSHRVRHDGTWYVSVDEIN